MAERDNEITGANSFSFVFTTDPGPSLTRGILCRKKNPQFEHSSHASQTHRRKNDFIMCNARLKS